MKKDTIDDVIILGMLILFFALCILYLQGIFLPSSL